MFHRFPRTVSSNQDLTTFRNILAMYKGWAGHLSNDNILDVARSMETVLASEPARQQLLQYRVDHLRRLGIFEISEEEVRRQKAERNLQRALAKRQQMEQQKDAEMRKASHNSDDAISEADDRPDEYEEESGAESS